MKSITFVKVASTDDLPEGTMRNIEHGGKRILLVNVKGKYYGLGNHCTHRGCTLSDGHLIDTKVKCPCHGSEFDLQTGKAVHGPAKDPEPRYEVKKEKDQILVRI